MTNRQKKIIVCSTRKLVDKSKLTGELDLCNILTYQAFVDQLEFTKNISGLEDLNKQFQDNIIDYENNNDDIVDNIKSILPDEPYTTDGNNNIIDPDGGSIVSPTNPIASDFTTTNIVQEDIFGVGPTYDTYVFTIADFSAAYSDNNDNDFYSIRIDRTDLDQMALKRMDSPTTGNVFGENPSSITILKADIPKWRLIASSSATKYTHDISFKIIDYINGQFLESNTATLTVNRTGGENQPATIGDNTIIVDNRAVTTFTLAMFTSQLQPPYNDPENDLIDAIRIDEISTANEGVFKLNGTILTENQIITREDLNAGLFTHEAANINTISSDVFSFSARDEGSQIWVS